MDKTGYKYLVEFKIDVRRTDNQMLTNDENAMVHEMQTATHEVIRRIMNTHGQNRVKHLKDETVIY